MKFTLSDIRQRKDIIVINAIFIVGILLVIGYLLRPQETIRDPIVRTDLENKETLNEETVIEYIGEKKETPTSFTIYSVRLQSQPNVGQLLQTHFLLQSIQTNFFISEDQQISANYIPINETWSFSNENLSPNNEILSLQSAEEYAKSWLEKLNIPTDNLLLSHDLTQYFTINENSTHYENSNPENARLIRIVFAPVIDKYPIAFQNDSAESYSFDISAKGVYKATFSPRWFAVTPTNNKLSLSVDEAFEQVKSGNYRVLTEFLRTTGENEAETTKITLKNVQIVYRFTPQDSLAIPYYDFSGEVTLKNGIVSPVVLTTPAVRTIL